MSHLSENVIIGQSSWANVVTITTQFSAAVDMRDAEGLMVVMLGSTDTSGTTQYDWGMHLQGASDTGATFVKIGSTSVCFTADAAEDSIDNKILILDTLHPGKNFVRVCPNQTSGLAVRIMTMKYGLRKRGSSGINLDQSQVGAHVMVTNSCSTA